MFQASFLRDKFQAAKTLGCIMRPVILSDDSEILVEIIYCNFNQTCNVKVVLRGVCSLMFLYNNEITAIYIYTNFYS